MNLVCFVLSWRACLRGLLFSCLSCFRGNDNGPVSDIEQRIDELYQLAPGEFTAARNALAKTLKGAEATRVKALVKPTAVPWAVNQLYWRRRSTYDRLLAAGGVLRDAQIAALGGRGGPGADVGRANDAHRKALADAVREANEVASAHGIKPAVDQLSRMLEMLSLRAEDDESPGRHLDLVQASGLEALAGIALAEGTTFERPKIVHLPAREKKRGLEAAPDSDAERRRMEEAAAARKAAEQRVEDAERALDGARDVEAAAQKDVAEAEAVLEQAQKAVEEARRARRAASEALNAARAAAR